MRQFGRLILGLALVFAGGRLVAATDAPRKLGTGDAYETLAKLPVMHAGRVKPLDTLAREEVKQIFGRETVKLLDASNKVVETWGPVAALFDWTVRPSFWDDQPFILVEFLPLKRLILADSLTARLGAIADKKETSDADRTAAKALAAKTDLSAANLIKFAASAHLSDDDRAAVKALAAELSEEHKWLSPRELESAKVTVGGQKLDFNSWFRDIAQRRREGADNPNAPKLSELENRTLEVGTRLVHYQAIRDREIRSVEPMLVMPRPYGPDYLAFTAKTVDKARAEGIDGLILLELDALKALDTFWNDIPIDDRSVPGKDAKFDAAYSAWLRDKSVWVPLKVILDAKSADLAASAYPKERVEAFRAAFKAMDEAEAASPGAVSQARAEGLVAASRDLGKSINESSYPSPKILDLETYFNETNPFWKAPYAYGLALALLAVSLGFVADRRSAMGKAGRLVYGLGVVALATGIAYEVFGFSMRIRISGWAPVTNMYETVIWVSLVAAVLGLVFEMIFRKTYTALAASGVALLGTVLAANTPLLDPSIKSLQPVLRSNYWLTIHVLTEVSSYAAFALAMGLGMIATFYYLTATYRRSPSYAELAAPLAPGLPMLGMGVLVLLASYGRLGTQWAVGGNTAYYLGSALAAMGGVFTIMSVLSIAGEAVSRVFFREDAMLDGADIAGQSRSAPAATSVQMVSVGEQSGAVATLTKPSIAEIRARAAQSRPKLDARGLAMQATAAKIKPLSNFIYRTMQVGVLLIAAGTILGGVWADYSWGRFWGWDPKEVWALITLLVYLIPLHGRFAGWVNTFGLVVASVVCFLSVIMAWYGVNFVLGVGLHSYGFVEGGSQGAVAAVVAGVLAIPAAAAYRRALASRAPSGA